MDEQPKKDESNLEQKKDDLLKRIEELNQKVALIEARLKGVQETPDEKEESKLKKYSWS
jgi:hypothetical protein